MSTWKLEGYDEFDGEYYPLGQFKDSNGKPVDGLKDSYGSYDEALEGARQRLQDLERHQPTSSSGGQAMGGIQDRVYIVHPDGRRQRVFK